ncbi:MAG TPA: TerC family protein [Acetobacteraceae bacterium]|nr:TerC family protein [Acetobacteraceae bacterium]
MSWLLDPQIWASFFALLALEIVLGIDNLVFVAISADRLPPGRRAAARRIGLTLALLMRIGLLLAISWLAHLTAPVFSIAEHTISWRDMILIAGGAFLIYKGTSEIHKRVEGSDDAAARTEAAASFNGTIALIVALDIVFSLDSVITAIGIAEHVWVMIAAIVGAMLLMIAASAPLADFVGRHPTLKMLALSFLLLIGMTLVADGAGFHVPRGYIYAAMGFSCLVEALNLLSARRRRRGQTRESA